MPKPPAETGRLRRLIRDVLALAPGYALEDVALCAAVRELLPMHSAEDYHILAAAEWNLAKGYAAAADNEDTDNREWRITKDGLAKQSIK